MCMCIQDIAPQWRKIHKRAIHVLSACADDDDLFIHMMFLYRGISDSGLHLQWPFRHFLHGPQVVPSFLGVLRHAGPLK
jgi:hypothetical protein